MSVSSLTLEEFQELLDRFGSDLSVWPDPQRAAVCVETFPEAADLLRQAQAVEAGLAQPPKAPEGLADRIVAEALRRSPPRKT